MILSLKQNSYQIRKFIKRQLRMMQQLLHITARWYGELPGACPAAGGVSGLACIFALNAEVLTKAGKVPIGG